MEKQEQEPSVAETETKESDIRRIHENYLEIIEKRVELKQQKNEIERQLGENLDLLKNPDKRLIDSNLFFEGYGEAQNIGSLENLKKELDRLGVKEFPKHAGLVTMGGISEVRFPTSASKEEKIKLMMPFLTVLYGGETSSELKYMVSNAVLIDVLKHNGWKLLWNENLRDQSQTYGMVKELPEEETEKK